MAARENPEDEFHSFEASRRIHKLRKAPLGLLHNVRQPGFEPGALWSHVSEPFLKIGAHKIGATIKAPVLGLSPRNGANRKS